MLPGAVEASVQELDSLLQVVSVRRHHSVSDHLLLPDQTLQLVSSEGLQPARSHDQVFGMSFKTSQDADVVVNAEHAPLLRPPVHGLQLRDGVHPDAAAGTGGDASDWEQQVPSRLTEGGSSSEQNPENRHVPVSSGTVQQQLGSALILLILVFLDRSIS